MTSVEVCRRGAALRRWQPRCEDGLRVESGSFLELPCRRDECVDPTLGLRPLAAAQSERMQGRSQDEKQWPL